MKDLHKANLRGHMTTFIGNFLKNRQFQVRIGSTLYEIHTQEMGVPQGSILSVTLFVLKINQLAEIIDHDVLRSLFVDDFQICFKSKSMKTIERKLQHNLYKISEWAELNGFKFSCSKTVAMHFWKYLKSPRSPVLELNNKKLKIEDKYKFLGLIWDRGLTFKDHIQYLKAKCIKTLNLLRVLAHTSWGADTATLLKLFKALIRSKLDYGSMVYQSASQTDLNSLYTVQNEALRVCTGAFRSSPVSSIHIECNEMPPLIRNWQLSLQYLVKLKANKENPAYKYVIPKECQDSSSDESSSSEKDFEPKEGRKNLPKIFRDRMQEHLDGSGINLELLAQTEIPAIEPWNLAEPRIDLTLAESSKESTNPLWYTNTHRGLLEQYREYTPIYIDGSKIDEKVGAASAWEYGTIKTRLPDGCSIFSAEAVALLNALKIINCSQMKKFIIFTDSLSCLESIQNEDFNNSLILNFLEQYTRGVAIGKETILCWVPGHVGIKGNEEADTHAKAALNISDIKVMDIPYTDFKPVIKEYFQNMWQTRWDLSTDFLTIISPTIGHKKYNSELTRKEQVVLSRIRIGHTRLTHSYLMSKEEPPQCDYCKTALTVEHIMVDCHKFNNAREQNLIGSTIEEIYANDNRNIIKFVRDCDIFSDI